MIVKTHFVEHPNGIIAVADIEPQQAMDQTVAASLGRRLSAKLGGLPALLRCRIGSAFFFHGDASLYRYGVDPMIDALPIVEIDV